MVLADFYYKLLILNFVKILGFLIFIAYFCAIIDLVYQTSEKKVHNQII